MNKGLIFTFGVITGVVGGGLAVNFALKQRYEQKADEEITSCRVAFQDELAKLRAKADEKDREEKKEAAVEAVKSYSPEPEKAAKMVTNSDKPKGPYIISPDIFDDEGNPNKCMGLKYYPASGVVLLGNSTTPMTMEELDDTVGREALTHFGDNDRVCVRNERQGIDYEIVMMPGDFKR